MILLIANGLKLEVHEQLQTIQFSFHNVMLKHTHLHSNNMKKDCICMYVYSEEDKFQQRLTCCNKFPGVVKLFSQAQHFKYISFAFPVEWLTPACVTTLLLRGDT